MGMNTISEATMGFPGLSGDIPHEAVQRTYQGSAAAERPLSMIAQ
jgi:hypothetical protein